MTQHVLTGYGTDRWQLSRDRKIKHFRVAVGNELYFYEKWYPSLQMYTIQRNETGTVCMQIGDTYAKIIIYLSINLPCQYNVLCQSIAKCSPSGECQPGLSTGQPRPLASAFNLWEQHFISVIGHRSIALKPTQKTPSWRKHIPPVSQTRGSLIWGKLLDREVKNF